MSKPWVSGGGKKSAPTSSPFAKKIMSGPPAQKPILAKPLAKIQKSGRKK